jgi:hypothetical protein
MAILGLVLFVGLTPNIIFSQKSGIANLAGIENRFLPLLEDDELVVIAGPATMAAGSTQITAGSTPPVTAKNWYEIVGGDSMELGVGIQCCVCRNGIFAIASGHAELAQVGCGFVDVDHHASATIGLTRVRAAGLAKNGIRIDDVSRASLYSVWIDTSSKSGISIEDGATVELTDVGGATANIVDYGLLLTRAVRVTTDADVDLEGVKGKVRFNQTAATVNYPVAGACETDGQGSFIVK